MKISIHDFDQSIVSELSTFQRRNCIQKGLDSLYDIAPYGARLSLNLSREECSNYSIEINLSSLKLNVTNLSKHICPEQGLMEAISTLKRKVQNWSKTRSLNYCV